MTGIISCVDITTCVVARRAMPRGQRSPESAKHLNATTSRWGSLSRYRRLTIIGLVLFGLMFIVGDAVIPALSGEVEDVDIVEDGGGSGLFAGLLFAAPAWVIAGLLWRFGTLPLILAGLWMTLSAVAHIQFFFQPDAERNIWKVIGIAVVVIAPLAILSTASLAYLRERRSKRLAAST